MRKVTSVKGITNPYSKRILSNVLNKDPMKTLAGTPTALKRLTRGLTEKQLRTPPGKERWSIVQIVSHLCDAEWATGYRVRKIIAEPGAPIQAYDQDEWAKHLHYGEMAFKEKLTLFEALRRSHVSLIKVLSSKEMQRYGMHEERGKETVERMFHMLAGHDVNHVRQVEEIRNRLLRKKR